MERKKQDERKKVRLREMETTGKVGRKLWEKEVSRKPDERRKRRR